MHVSNKEKTMKWQLISSAAVVALAFGSTSALAASEAEVSQTGSVNEAYVEQGNNQYASTKINVLGHHNRTDVLQTNNPSANARITVQDWSNGNNANIVNKNVQ